jgi:peroxiredoxin
MVKNLLILLMILGTACNGNRSKNDHSAEPGDIIISGQLKDGADQLVTLDLMGVSAFVPIDSTRCDREGKFSFAFQGTVMNYYSLKFTEQGYVTLIAEPGDKIIITGSADRIYPYKVEGSEGSDLLRELAEAHMETMDRLRSLSEKSEMITRDVNFSKRKLEINEAFDSVTTAFNQYSREFIMKHPGSPSILISLYNQFGPDLPVFDPVTDLDVYTFVDSALYSRFPDNEAVKSLHSYLSAALQQLKNQQPNARLSAGDKAPDFVMNTDDNQVLALADLKGNYILLQVWASWSNPSAEENKYLEACYREFEDENFVIVQASIDSDRDKWNAALETRRDGWYHVSDLMRWESAIVNLYRIERIPANFLINPEGIIVETDIFGDELLQTVKKYLP